MMKVLACYSVKGGVGKTATAVNLAYLAAREGKRTLLIDLDPQGASSFYFRVRPVKKAFGKRFFDAYKELLKHIRASDYENLDILPASLAFRHFDVFLGDMKKRENRLKRVLKGFRKEYDLVVLDCPPSIGYLSEAVFTASDLMLVPVIPTTLSERTYEQLLDFLKDNDYSQKKVVPFFSMVESRKSLHKSTMDAMRSRQKRMLDISIPHSADVEKMGQHRAPLETFAASSSAAEAYRQLWDAVSKRHL